jgi:hypothetical protein
VLVINKTKADIANGGRAPEARFINRGVEANPTHVQWLIDKFGNKRGYKPVPIVNGQEAPRMGKCGVPGFNRFASKTVRTTWC